MSSASSSGPTRVHQDPQAAATLAALELQVPALLRLERCPRVAGARVVKNEAVWSWFEGLEEELRHRVTASGDRTVVSVCHAAARDGADALLLSLRQEGGGSAWRLVELAKLDREEDCDDVLPAKVARDSAAGLVARAVLVVSADRAAAGGGTVSLGVGDVRDVAELRATLRDALLACSFTVPVALVPDGMSHGSAHQSRGELHGCLVGGMLAEHILIAIEHGFLEQQADDAAEELLREECAATGARSSTGGRKSGSSKRRGSNAKRKQREKEQAASVVDAVVMQNVEELSVSAGVAELPSARDESLAPQVESIPTGLLIQLGADVTEMAAALAAIQDKRRPWELGVVEMM